MAGFTPVVAMLGSLGGQIGTVATAIGTIATAVETVQDIKNDKKAQEQNLRHLQEKQRLDQQQAAENAAVERQKMQIEADAEEQRRQRALKNAVARQRASFGASGVSAGSSASAQAVLLGAFNESEEEAASRARLDRLRENSLSQGTSQLAQRNLLTQTQTAEKQHLQRIMDGV